MRSPRDDFAMSAINKSNTNNNAIPYHARENSLPFSYGQINKTSASLRSTPATAHYYKNSAKDYFDFNFELDSSPERRDFAVNRAFSFSEDKSHRPNVNYGYNNNNNNKPTQREDSSENRHFYINNCNNFNDSSQTDIKSTYETDAGRMIKSQPRLTSPLLVRKTLNNNNNSNTHTQTFNSRRSPTRSTTNTIANTYQYSYGHSGHSDNFDNFNINGNNSKNNYDCDHRALNYSSNDTLRKTPTRYDFEELLRERREKVFTEYGNNSHETSPIPPPRRSINGTVQLPSTLRRSPPMPRRSHSSQSRNYNYNYDFEFNLNLNDEKEEPLHMKRRSRTLDRSPQKQRYETNDIPLASSYVEHNYHTISSSSPSTNYANNNFMKRTTNHKQIQTNPYNERETAPTAFDGYAMRRMQSEIPEMMTLRSNRSNSITYGNEQQMYSSDRIMERASSPIYATSMKKATNTYERCITAPAFVNDDMSTTAATLTITDYPTTSMMMRPETPAFPVTPRTPYAGVHNINGVNKTNGYHQHQHHQQLIRQQQQQQYQSRLPHQPAAQSYSTETIYGTHYRPRLNSTLSTTNSEPQDVAPHLVKFAKDSSRFWYKPNLSREEAISLLLNAPPGTFLVRDSTTYKNAYGLVLRVAQAPPGTTSTGKPEDLVRHFLIEPTTRGVRLKGCANEPVFTSLSALVYEHSINQLALPCLLQIPERDLVPPLMEPTPAQKQLLTQGAACNVLWLFSCDTESLTGEEAIRKAIRQMHAQSTEPNPTEVHFKVTQQGITLTDNTRKKFFRKHYTADTISYCAIDPDHRVWTMQQHGNDNTTVVGALKKTIFAFVARRSPSSKDNQCHVFCDLAINQPASAIVSFVNKTLPTEKQKNYVL